MKWTREVFERAFYLHDVQGLTWKIVALRLGTTNQCLSVQLHNYRSGKIKFLHEKTAARVAEAEEHFAGGGRNVELAQRWGVSSAAITQFCKDHGLDEETRAELLLSTLHSMQVVL